VALVLGTILAIWILAFSAWCWHFSRDPLFIPVGIASAAVAYALPAAWLFLSGVLVLVTQILDRRAP
jgi:hypothetical protein